MLFDIKKLFAKDTQIGRFEYFKIIWGLVLIPMLVLYWAVLTPFESPIIYLAAIFTGLFVLCYVIIFWVATYKRLINIFGRGVVSAISFFVVFLSGIIKILRTFFILLLMLIPGKKESDKIVSNKLIWVTLPIIIVLFVVFHVSGVLRYAASEAMADSIKAGDRVVINVFKKDYKRGDIIVHKAEGKTVYIKRIVALPNEKVEIKKLKDGSTYIFVNDKKLDEPYVKDVFDYPECPSIEVKDQDNKTLKCAPIIVPQDSYYVVGDNRGRSYDSRYYGAVHKDLIKGVVSHIYYPINRRKSFNF